MLAGHLTIHLTSRLNHESFMHLSARGRCGPSGPTRYSRDSVLQYHISAVDAICIMKAQPLVISNLNWVLRCLVLL